jgi:nucleotide-binding universal stress UspA family protein
MANRRILCAIDFSPAARSALDLAARLAQEGGATLEVVHVVERHRLLEAIGDQPDAGHLVTELGDRAEHQLEGWRAETAARLAAVEAIVLGGRAWEEIAGEAGRWGADLVVVGRSEPGRQLLGSVAERIVRHAPCSVLVVPATVDAARRPAALLCAIDFSSSSRAAADAAVELAAASGGRTTLLHVLVPPRFGPGLLQQDALLGAARREAEGKLEHWIADLRRGAARLEGKVIAAAAAAEAILETARAGDRDLIVVGTHGRTGMGRAILGSVAERVVRGADRPVLVVRPLADSTIRATSVAGR